MHHVDPTPSAAPAADSSRSSPMTAHTPTAHTLDALTADSTSQKPAESSSTSARAPQLATALLSVQTEISARERSTRRKPLSSPSSSTTPTA